MMNRRVSDSTELHFLVLKRRDDTYLFRFDEQNVTETLRQFGKFAANPDIGFTWYDAAICSHRLKQEIEAGHGTDQAGAGRW